jgi:hypothetical protein
MLEHTKTSAKVHVRHGLSSSTASPSLIGLFVALSYGMWFCEIEEFSRPVPPADETFKAC